MTTPPTAVPRANALHTAPGRPWLRRTIDLSLGIAWWAVLPSVLTALVLAGAERKAAA